MCWSTRSGTTLNQLFMQDLHLPKFPTHSEDRGLCSQDADKASNPDTGPTPPTFAPLHQPVEPPPGIPSNANGRHGWRCGEDTRAYGPSVPTIPVLTPGASGGKGDVDMEIEKEGVEKKVKSRQPKKKPRPTKSQRRNIRRKAKKE